MALTVVLKNHYLIPSGISRTFYSFRYSSYSSKKIVANDEIILPKNMALRHSSANSTLHPGSNQTNLSKTTAQRPLTLMFAWMLANDKSLEKYRQLWFRRGFDVLTVRTSPLDLLLPPIGSRVVSNNLLEVISKFMAQYNEIVVHAFSVGAFQFGETLVQIRAQEEYLNVLNSIKGVIIDSAVFIQDCAPGLSKAITLNPVIQPMIENSINIYLKLFYNISIKNYENAIQELVMPSAKYPGLILYSKDDVISSVERNEDLVKNWIKLGNKVRYKCWDESTHVSHLKNHRKEYERELDAFLHGLNLRTAIVQ